MTNIVNLSHLAEIFGRWVPGGSCSVRYGSVGRDRRPLSARAVLAFVASAWGVR